MNYLSIIIKTVIASVAIISATLFAKYSDPKWAGLIVAAPIATIIALFFIATENNKELVSKYLLSSIYFMLPAFIFLLSTYLFMKKFEWYSSLGFSVIIFGVIVVIMQKFI